MGRRDWPRLDVLATERGLFSSRSRAKRAIMAGSVYVDGSRVDKAGTRVPADVEIEVRGERLPYVSRGGLKLEKALNHWPVSVEGRTCLDIGASTGGFTDCMLQHGAKHVIAVDVGYGQLAWSLRQDARVTVMERTNARYLQPDELELDGQPVRPSLISIDVAFISLRHILPACQPILAPDGDLIALIKPQFEAGPERVGDGGIVRDPTVHAGVLHEIGAFIRSNHWCAYGLTGSPVRGAKGNREFLVWLRRPEKEVCTGAMEAEDWSKRVKALMDEH